MSYKRLAMGILVVGLVLVSGCQTNSCYSPCNGGLMSRLGWTRTRPVFDGTVVGTPVSSMPISGGCDGGYGGGDHFEGPTLGDPTFMGTPYQNMPTIPPSTTTLPPPMAIDGGLRPVPGTTVPGTATPIPAGPSSRSRW